MRKYLVHVWWQLGTYEANTVVRHGGDGAWAHHRLGRCLTRYASVMVQVAVVPSFFHICAPDDMEKRILTMTKHQHYNIRL